MSYRHFYILHFVFYNLSRRMTGFYIFHRLIHNERNYYFQIPKVVDTFLSCNRRFKLSNHAENAAFAEGSLSSLCKRCVLCVKKCQLLR